MNLGGGFVDTLRIGDGVRQGTARGILQDGLRLLSLAGPIARVGRGIARIAVPNPSGEICGFVSGTRALRQTGSKHLAVIEDLIKASGRDPGAVLGGMESGRVLMKNLEEALKSAGAEVCTLPKPATIAGVTELAKKKRSAGRASRSGRSRQSESGRAS